MPAAPLHPRESERLAALRALDILDTPAEAEFDDVARLAAWICHKPIATVSLVDEDRQWFKARIGTDVTGTPREQAICGYTILQTDVFVVPDTLADPRFCDNEVCTARPGVRFYAGAPLLTEEGLPLGTLCVMDTMPGEIDDEQRDALRILASQVSRQIEYRRAMARQQVILREGAHRAKNALSVTQAIARLSLKAASSLEDFAESFPNRLQGIATAHTSLANGVDAADLSTLIRDQAAPMTPDESRFAVEGPALTVDAKAAEGLGLAIHELATNAVKYGAWKGEAGRVDVRWDRTEHGVRLRWEETGALRPVAPATRRGFGSMLLDEIAPAMMGGQGRLTIQPGGVVWESTLAADRLGA